MALHLGSGPRGGQDTSQETAGPALEPGLTTPGYPRTPRPSKAPPRPPRASLSLGPLRTSLLPVAGRGPAGPGEGETGHPPKSMAASLTEARAAPPPQGGECRAGATAQWAVPGGGTIGRALVPAHSLSSRSTPSVVDRPPLRAHAHSSPTSPQRRGTKPTAPPTGPRPPPRQQPGTRSALAPLCARSYLPLGPAPSSSSLRSAAHLSSPCPALLPAHSVGPTH